MSIDKLQSKIRKMKCPVALDMFMPESHVPSAYFNTCDGFLSAYVCYVTDLLNTLHTVVPAVRLSFAMLSAYGLEGAKALSDLLHTAKKLGYYVFLDIPEALSRQSAKHLAKVFMDENANWVFDALVVSSYIGSDGIAPYVVELKKNDKDLFVVTRTSNKSAAEIQDLLSGSRLAHIAMADIVYRFAPEYVTRCGYSRVALVAGASSADSLRSLRTKYKDVFMLLDGSDYPNANAKNCSFAFDRLGHGAIACVGYSVTAAWQTEEGENHLDAAVGAVERMKKNVARYITIL